MFQTCTYWHPFISVLMVNKLRSTINKLALHGIYSPSTTNNYILRTNSASTAHISPFYGKYIRFPWHKFAFHERHSPFMAQIRLLQHTSAFHGIHPFFTAQIRLSWGISASCSTYLPSTVQFHLRHTSPFSWYIFAFYGTNPPPTAHIRLLWHICASYGTHSRFLHTFTLKRCKINKSSTALIIIKHDLIMTCPSKISPKITANNIGTYICCSEWRIFKILSPIA